MEANFWSYQAQLLKRCGESRDAAAGIAAAGIAAHEQLQRLGIDRRDAYLGNLLVQMYGKCGYVEEAMAVFRRMEARNVFSWTILMDACLENGSIETTLELFRQMLLEGVRPDRVVFLSALKACSKLRDMEIGEELENALVSCFPACFDPAVLTALLNMYASCGSLEDAMRIFERFQTKDLVAWNSMLAAYAKLDKGGELAVLFFRKMLLEGLKPNAVSFASVVGSCSKPDLWRIGSRFQELIVENGIVADSFLAAALVNMHSKSGRIDDAIAILERFDLKNSLISWNSIVAALAQRDDLTQVLRFFGMIQLEGLKPSAVTLISVLGACNSIRAVAIVEQIRQRIELDVEFSRDSILGTALITSFCNCSKLSDAESFFYRAKCRSTASWNAMIAGYVQYGRDLQALRLLRKMDLEGIKQNSVTFLGSNVGINAILGTAILNMYASCDDLENSRQAFDILISKDTISWNAVIASHVDSEASLFFMKMELEGIKPDKNTLTVMLAASKTRQQVVSSIELYGRFGDLIAARSIFDQQETKSIVSWTAMVSIYMNNENTIDEAWILFRRMQLEGIKPNNVTFISMLGSNCSSNQALMSMYARTGNFHRIQTVFENLQQSSEVSWNSLLRVYAEQGHVYEVLYSYRCMIQLGITPNTDTFIFLLHACSHAGIVEQGIEFFVSIVVDYQSRPAIQHYVCVIDLLGRSGRIENADELVNRMPYEPNSLAWSTLLGACGKYGDTYRGVHAAEMVTKTETETGLGHSYVLLANILSSTT